MAVCAHVHSGTHVWTAEGNLLTSSLLSLWLQELPLGCRVGTTNGLTS